MWLGGQDWDSRGVGHCREGLTHSVPSTGPDPAPGDAGSVSTAAGMVTLGPLAAWGWGTGSPSPSLPPQAGEPAGPLMAGIMSRALGLCKEEFIQF